MRTRPTPAPWHYETNAQGNVVIYATRNGDDDKVILGMSHYGTPKQREADARLICALVNGETQKALGAARHSIDDIISKAEGVIERATVHTDAVAFAAGQIDAAENVAMALGAAPERSGHCTYLSDDDAYYLRSILARLRAYSAEIQDGPSLAGEALADNIDWLDCFIEKHSLGVAS